MSTTKNEQGWIGHREQVPAADLPDLLADFFRDENGVVLACFHLLSSPAEIGDLQAGLPHDSTAWQEGRCFGFRGEIRWRRQSDDTFALLCLTEQEDAMPDGFSAAEWCVRRPVKEGDAAIHLWPPAEVRIPRQLRYPGNGRYILYREYQTAGGVTQFTRLVEVVK